MKGKGQAVRPKKPRPADTFIEDPHSRLYPIDALVPTGEGRQPLHAG